MAVANTTNSPLSSAEKSSVDHAEDVEAGSQFQTHNRRESLKLHGDRGLALVGDERIPLTEANVRSFAFHPGTMEIMPS